MIHELEREQKILLEALRGLTRSPHFQPDKHPETMRTLEVFANDSKAGTFSNPAVGDENLDLVNESQLEEYPGKMTQPQTVDGRHLDFSSAESIGSQTSAKNLSAKVESLRQTSIPYILNKRKFSFKEVNHSLTQDELLFPDRRKLRALELQ